ncbi:MAG: hypothetical protein M3P70_13560 [Actinomycetota bacterium]|nr:hypothetical protein [Actinomycetota bacterium]
MVAVSTGAVERVGIAGEVRGYAVLVVGDRVVVSLEDGSTLYRHVDGLGAFVAAAQEFRLGWAELPDFEVVYLYDAADEAFGYAFNLSDTGLSEWGYAPFRA